MKTLQLLISIIVLNTTAVITTKMDTPLNGTLSFLLQNLFSPEETLQIIYDNPNHHDDTLVKLTNPYTITNINKPSKSGLSIFYNYVIFTKNHTLLNYTLIRLKEGYLWDQSNSRRGNFVIITPNEANTSAVVGLFRDHEIIHVFILKQSFDNSKIQVNRQLGDSIQYSEQDKYKMCRKKIIKIQEGTIKMIVPYQADIADPRYRSISVIFGLILDNLKIIGKYLNVSVSVISRVRREDVKNCIYNKSKDIYVLLSTTREARFYEDYDVSDYIFQQKMTWAVPKAGRTSTFQLIISILEMRVWITLIISLVTISVLCWIFERQSKEKTKYTDFQTCILNTFVVTLGIASCLIPKTKPVKILIIFYFFYSMQISTLFQGKLFSGLAHPSIEDGITTTKELAESSLTPIGSERTRWFLLQYFSNDSVFSKIHKRIIIQDPLDIEDNLHKVARFKNVSTIVGKTDFGYLYKKFKPFVYLIEEHTGIIEFDLSLAIRKGHYFLNILNKFGRRIIESGIHGKILSDAVAAYKGEEIEDESGASVLTMDHLYGIFIIWVLGLSLATIIFALELLYVIFLSQV